MVAPGRAGAGRGWDRGLGSLDGGGLMNRILDAYVLPWLLGAVLALSGGMVLAGLTLALVRELVR